MNKAAPKGFFVSATGTGVGKSVVSAALCLALEADYFKPLQSGWPQDDDTDEVRRLTGFESNRFHAPAHRLTAPLSPHEAALRQGLDIDFSALTLPQSKRPLIVEGAGGLYVPIDERHMMIDLIERFGLPVILVCPTGLGCINHSLLSLKALEERGISLAGLVFCGPENEYNMQTIAAQGGAEVLFRLPELNPLTPESLRACVSEIKLGETLKTLLEVEPSADSGVVELDLAHVWHPFTQAATMPRPREIAKASGVWLHDGSGKQIIDLISSWWLTLHGHSHPRLAQALAKQARRMEHVIFANFTHEPAARLAYELSRILPGDLSRVFYSDNGSTAVEVALKIALQYARNIGEPKRKRLASFQGGYHGDTAGAMSVGYSCGFYKGFDDYVFEVEFLPYPATWIDDPKVEAKEAAALADIEAYLEKYPGEVAGVIIEPLVQGASGMRMCRPEFLREADKLIKRAGALFIFDEVMTGFGRTGTMFACEQAGVVPDVICLGKGLTGGFMPLAATVTSDRIYDAFKSESFDSALAHGHSFAGNPLGCAVALASLELMREDNDLEKVAQINLLHRKELSKLAGLPNVGRTRATGCIAAFDALSSDPRYAGEQAEKLKRHFMDQGLLLRPLGNVLYILPPYCVKFEELELAYQALGQAMRELK